MNVVNVTVPPTLRGLSSEELKLLAIYTINGRGGKEVLAEVLSARLDTKRKINNVIAGIMPMELAAFALDLRTAGVSIDFSKAYFLLSEPLRGILSVKQ